MAESRFFGVHGSIPAAVDAGIGIQLKVPNMTGGLGASMQRDLIETAAFQGIGVMLCWSDSLLSLAMRRKAQLTLCSVCCHCRTPIRSRDSPFVFSPLSIRFSDQIHHYLARAPVLRSSSVVLPCCCRRSIRTTSVRVWSLSPLKDAVLFPTHLLRYFALRDLEYCTSSDRCRSCKPARETDTPG